MSMRFINSEENMQWLWEVHLSKLGIDREYGAAIIHGNDDWPELIELWRDHTPHYKAAPDCIVTKEEIDKVYR